jgi:drug/metabolite transporter (DMT)-like permease
VNWMRLRWSRSDLLMLITTSIWGWSFIIVKWSVSSIDPYCFIFSRFGLALMLLAAIFHRKIKDNWRRCLRPGVFLGALLALAFITQTLGLKYTTASASGFITGLNVILVAVFAAAINRRIPHPLVSAGIAVATAGLLLITFKGALVFEKGDLLTLACAVLFAIHVVYTDRLARGLDASILTIVQFVTVLGIAGVAYLLLGDHSLPLLKLTPLQWLATGYSGLLATGLAFLFQTKAQQEIPAFRTAILLATEPLFAGAFAMGLGFDPFDWKVVLGGLCIFLGMICASWDSKPQPSARMTETITAPEEFSE